MIPITVAIPTFNRPGFLRRAVRCVLNQTFTSFELIVLDNASEERHWLDMPELTDPRVRVVCHPTNIGVVNNWNAAVKEAKGEAICIFHDDDVMYPRYLEAIVDLLESYPTAGMAMSLSRRADCLGRQLGDWWLPTSPHQKGLMTGRDYLMLGLWMIGTPALPSSVTIRKSAYEKVGLYGGISKSSFDLNYYLRVARQFDIAIVKEILIEYTLHPGQISEEVWRKQVQEGRVDNCLEILDLATWLLEQETLPDQARREIATTLREVTQRISRYVAARTTRGPML
jgi:glycosyltransferase involved in cell wall biosynthesis